MIRSFYFLFFNELFVEYVVHLLLYWPNLVLVWVFKEQQLKKGVHMIKLHILYGCRMCTSLSKQLKKDVHMIKKVQDMRVSSFEDHMDLIIVCPSSFFSNSSYRCLPFLFILVWLMSNESYHWTRQDPDMCPLLDTCPMITFTRHKFFHFFPSSTFLLELWYLVVFPTPN